MYDTSDNICDASHLGFLIRLNGVAHFRMAYEQLRMGCSPLNFWLHNSFLLSNSFRMAAEKRGKG